MGIKVANNAFGTLASSITNSATSITLTTGQGARFPTLSAGDYFYATLIDTSNNLEIVKCTARSTDVLTITRAQENTTARAYSAGDRIEIRLTAQSFLDATNIPTQSGNDGKFLQTDGENLSWETVTTDLVGDTSPQLGGNLDPNGYGVSNHWLPSTNDSYDLGSTSAVWRNIYTGDLHLSNQAKEQGNAVDGTKGNWTVQEGQNELFILNNLTGRKYKFLLQEIE
jgi:hypothetical protein